MKALCAPVHEPHLTAEGRLEKVYASNVRLGDFLQRESCPVDSQKLLVRLQGPLWGYFVLSSYAVALLTLNVQF